MVYNKQFYPSDDFFYNGNRNLMNARYRHSYTPEEIQEIVKCSQDPLYFINTYVYIVSLDKGLTIFKTYDFQNELIKSFHNHRNTIATLGRQQGKSVSVGAYFAWLVLFNKNYTCAMLANKETISKELLSRVKQIIEHLPLFLKPGILSWEAKSFKLSNGSRIIAAATSASAIRGMSINALMIDEMAFIPQNIVEEFFTSVFPTISSGSDTKCIIVSTPCGYNYFHKMWQGAIQGKNGFNPIRFTWRDMPGRTEEWGVLKEAEIGSVKFAQEYDVAFLGSSNTLIKASAIASLSPQDALKGSTYNFKIFEEPNPERTYLITVDPSEGLGLDDSAFIIFDVTEYPIKIVGTFRDNTISPIVLPQVVESAALKYNKAFVLVENNSIGSQVTDILHRDFEYENLVIFGFHNTKTIGIKTNKSNKRIGCNTFKDMVENQKLIITDEELISQISGFILTGQTYKADVGFKDDLVMCCVTMAYLSTTKDFRAITDANIRKEIQKEKLNSLQEQVMPFGLIVRNGDVIYDGTTSQIVGKELVWFPVPYSRDYSK